MSSPPFGGSNEMPTVFPDWSPYQDLDSAARAYLRDPEVALDALFGVLRGASVLCFTLERFVNEVNGVWQEVVICDGSRLVLWHGEDVAPGDGPAGAITSSLRVGCRRRLTRTSSGQARVDSIDVYLLLSSIDDAVPPPGIGEDEGRSTMRHDALRFGKTLDDGGPGQIARLEEFSRVVASLVGRPTL
jgi:hypothetical protein